MVLTSPKSIQTGGMTVLTTWGRHCNKFLFVNDEPVADLPTMNITVMPGYVNLYNKTSTAFNYAWKHFGTHYDWFLKADDDTYVVMENLRHLLKDYSPDVPLYFGDRFQGDFRGSPVEYASGGAGYVFNRAALKLYSTRTEICPKYIGACAEDVLFGVYMQQFNVSIGESRDELNRTRFHSGSAIYLLDVKDDTPDWYKNMSVYYRAKVQ